MKIAFCADVHLGNHRQHGGPVVAGLNDRARAVLGVLGAAHAYAMKEGCAAFVVLGDLFDTDDPSPQMLSAVQEIFGDDLGASNSMQTIVVMGNHDQHSTAPGDHALGPLAPVATIVAGPYVVKVGDVDLMLIPYRPGKASEWLEPEIMDLAKVALRKGSPRVLGIHLGVRDAYTAPFLQDSNDAIGADVLLRVAAAYKFDHVYAGNWHNRKTWQDARPAPAFQPRVTQIGALVPTGHDNPGLRGYGHVDIWDSEGKGHSFELPGPRFVATLAEVRTAAKFGNAPYLRMELPPGEDRTALVEEAELSGAVAVDVPPWRAGVTGAARGAALAAQGASTLDEALSEHVARAPLGDAIDRADVLARCRAYLKPAS